MIFFCLQLPYVGSDEVLPLDDEYHFLFAKHYKNLVHPCPPKSYDLLNSQV